MNEKITPEINDEANQDGQLRVDQLTRRLDHSVPDFPASASK